MKTKVYLIIIALILVGFLASLFLIQEKYLKTNNGSPIQLSYQGEQIKQSITKSNQKEGDLTSDYDTYTIDYLIANDRYIVTIKKTPFKESKKKAENWFLGQGFKQEDLCALKITFYPAKDLQDQGDPQDVFPTGCTK